MLEQHPPQPAQDAIEAQQIPVEQQVATETAVDPAAFAAAVEDPSKFSKFFQERKQALAAGWQSMKQRFADGGSNLHANSDFSDRIRPQLKPWEKVKAYTYEMATIPKQLGLFALESVSESPRTAAKAADARTGLSNPTVRRAAAKQGNFEAKQIEKSRERAKQEKAVAASNKRLTRDAAKNGFQVGGYTENGSAKFKKVA